MLRLHCLSLMDVRCDKCGTDYEFDEERVSPQGVSVRCTNCGHVFRVAKPQIPTPQPGEWMIRQTNGYVFTFRELTTLQKWIVERKVAREDEISRNGSTWKKLGSIPELATFFQVLESSPQIQQPRPAPVSSDDGSHDFDDMRQAPRSSRGGLVIGIVIGLLLAGGGVAAVVFKDRLIGTPQASAPVASNAALNGLIDTQLQAALRSYRRDTEAGFLAAGQYIDKLIELQPNATNTIAWSVIVDVAWAEASREQAEDLQTTIKSAATGKSQVPVTELANLAGQSAKLQADAAARGERASARLKKLLEIDAANDDAMRGAIRFYAFRGQKEAVTPILDRAKGQPLANDRELLLVQNELLATTQLDAAIAGFGALVERDSDDVAARYRLAKYLAKKNDPRALRELEEVLRRAPDHVRAASLKAQLSAAAQASGPTGPTAASAPAVAEPTDKPAPVEKKAPRETFESLMKKGEQLRARDKAQQALEVYERALILQPNDAEALTGLGFCYMDLDAAPAAIQEFTKAVAANSRYSDAHLGLGEAYRARNQKRDAVKHYQRYLDLAPDGAEAEVAKRALKDLGQQ